MNTDSLSRALMIASEFGQAEAVRWLIEKGADVRFLNDAALALAVKNDKGEVVRLLLEAGADKHAREDCLLWWAAKKGDMQMMGLFL